MKKLVLFVLSVGIIVFSSQADLSSHQTSVDKFTNMKVSSVIGQGPNAVVQPMLAVDAGPGPDAIVQQMLAVDSGPGPDNVFGEHISMGVQKQQMAVIIGPGPDASTSSVVPLLAVDIG